MNDGDQMLADEIRMMEEEGYLSGRWQRGLSWLRELQQLRAAKAADRERVMEVVRKIADDEIGDWNSSNDGLYSSVCAVADAIASRVADALAVPVRPALSDTDRRALVALRSFIAGIDGQRCHGNDWSAELALLDRLLESP